MLFKRKQESRFQFAHSVDPIKSCDWDEIEVPAKIQDLIRESMRTLSNSLSTKNEISNSLFTTDNKLDLKDLRERWLTKKELLMQNENSPRNKTKI